MVKNAPVGAHYGLIDWLAQRLTAIVMVVYTIFLAVWLAWCTPHSQAEWKQLFSGNFVRIFTLLTLLCLYYHAWIGVRDIVMDYIKQAGIRLTVYTAVIAALAAYTVWSVAILWGA